MTLRLGPSHWVQGAESPNSTNLWQRLPHPLVAGPCTVPIVEIRWLTAFIDLPDDRFDIGTTFWRQVTDSQLSAPRGDARQFATLIPADGDPYVRVQRTSEGPRIHIDLHVDSISDVRVAAEDFGATVDEDPDEDPDVDPGEDRRHVVMRSPTGMTFCLVSHHGESTRPDPTHPDTPHRLDQICLDVPAALFEQEARFWHSLTGWALHHSQLQEFAVLTQPSDVPLRVLLQRLGDDDAGEATRAHLDLACGHHVDDVARLHTELGAEFVAHGVRWTTMRDPAGLLYCLTQRDPITGVIAD